MSTETIKSTLATAVSTMNSMAALYDDYDEKLIALKKKYGPGSTSFEVEDKRAHDTFLHDFEQLRLKLAKAVATLREEHEATATFDPADLQQVNAAISLLEHRSISDVPAGVLESLRKHFAGKDQALIMIANSSGESGAYFTSKMFTPADHTDMERRVEVMRISPDGSRFELIAIRDRLLRFIDYMGLAFPAGSYQALDDLRTDYVANKMGLYSVGK